jgi:uncharacterized protein YwqG
MNFEVKNYTDLKVDNTDNTVEELDIQENNETKEVIDTKSKESDELMNEIVSEDIP